MTSVELGDKQCWICQGVWGFDPPRRHSWPPTGDVTIRGSHVYSLHGFQPWVLVLCSQTHTGTLFPDPHWYFVPRPTLVLCSQTHTGTLFPDPHWCFALRPTLVLCSQTHTGTLRLDPHWCFAPRPTLGDFRPHTPYFWSPVKIYQIQHWWQEGKVATEKVCTKINSLWSSALCYLRFIWTAIKLPSLCNCWSRNVEKVFQISVDFPLSFEYNNFSLPVTVCWQSSTYIRLPSAHWHCWFGVKSIQLV